MLRQGGGRCSVVSSRSSCARRLRGCRRHSPPCSSGTASSSRSIFIRPVRARSARTRSWSASSIPCSVSCGRCLAGSTSPCRSSRRLSQPDRSPSRRSGAPYKALLLNTAAPLRLLCTKFIAGLAGVSLQAVPPLVFLILWRLIGGHLALVETIVSLTGYALYIVFVAAVGLAAAAWSSSVAQAATGAVLVLLASWAIDVSEGFAALAWLGRAVDWSVTTQLAPMERGILSIGSVLWMASASLGALRLAWIGLRFDIPAHRRASGMLGLLLLVALVCSVARGERTRFDWTEARRNSFAPAVEQAVREIPLPLTLEVYLDRDDARRRQFESDALTKLRLARPDLEVRTPLDARPLPAEGEREEGYGKIVVRVGAASRQTYSTSRRELVTLLLEAAGRPAPDWQDPQYHGYPLVVTEARRNLVLATSYFALPLVFLLIGDLARPSGRTPR